MAKDIKASLTKIIKEGDPKVLVSEAEKVGQVLGRTGAKTSQIRNIFSAVKAMEKYDERKLHLLRPRLAYSRARHKELVPLEEMLQEAIVMVENEEMFDRFKEFFEAVVAYHRKYGKE